MEKQVIPDDVRGKIEKTAALRFPLLDLSKDAPRNARRNQARFIEGATFGYSLAQEEIERLKGLINLAYERGYNIGSTDEYNDTDKHDLGLHQLKTENNL